MNLLHEIFRTWKISLLSLMVLSAINICLYVYSTVKLDPHIAQLQAEYSEKRKLTLLGSAKDLSSIYAQGSRDLALFQERIPEKRSFARLMGDVFEMADSSGLHVGTVSYKPTQVAEEQLLQYSISFSVTGTYAAIKSFLSDLQQTPEMILIDSISLNSSGPEEGKIDLRLQLTAYFRMEAA